MRAYLTAVVSGVLAAGAVAHPGGETATIKSHATATYSDGSSTDRLYILQTEHGSETYLRVRCDRGAVAAVYHTVKSPRDAASGQATGKRMHKPITITKEWGASTPLLNKQIGWAPKGDHAAKAGGTKTGYDVKKVEGTGARMADDGGKMGHDDWHEVSLRDGAPNLCA